MFKPYSTLRHDHIGNALQGTLHVPCLLYAVENSERLLKDTQI